MKKLIVFSVLGLALLTGIFQLAHVMAAIDTNPTQAVASITQKDTTPTPSIQGGCTMEQGMCEGMMECDMSNCDMKFCEKQNGKCPPGQCKKCMK